MIFEGHALLFEDLLGGVVHDLLHKGQFLLGANQGNHDLGNDVIAAFLLHVDGSLQHGAGLHLGDFGVGHGQTAATVTHHGVGLVEGCNLVDDLVLGHAKILGQLFDFLGHVQVGHKLMQRRIQVADGHGTAFQGLVHGLEVTLLHGQNLCQRLFTLLLGVGQDHLAHGGNTAGLKEHVLGTAKANALCAEGNRLLGIAGRIGIGADHQLARLVGPAHEAGEIAGDGGFHGGDQAIVHIAGGAVHGDAITLVIDLASDGDGVVFLIELQVAAANYGRAAHATGNHRSVRGHAAESGQDGLGVIHALDVFRGGLTAHQDDLLLVLAVLGSGIGGEVDGTGTGSGRGGQTLGDDGRLLQGSSVKVGVQQAVQLLGLHLQHGFLFGKHAFVHQIHGDLQRGLSGALAVTGLEHEQLAALDGVLHILHVAVVIFQGLGDAHELVVHFGHLLMQLGDGLGGTDTGHHVFALSVEQVLTVELLLTGGGVAGEGNAGTGGLAHVAEHHGLHVHGSAPVAGDVVHAAVVDGAGVVPGTEHGLDGLHELLLGVLGEVHALFGLVDGLEALHNFLQVLGGQVTVKLHTALFLELVQHVLELALFDFHNHVGEHGDEAAIGVIGKVLVAGQLGQALDGDVVQAQVQDGVHHAGHGGAGTGTDGNQPGIVLIAKLLADDFFGFGQRVVNLLFNVGGNHFAIGIVAGAGFRGNGEALGHRQTNAGHLSQVGTLAAKQFAHVGVAFREEIDVLLLHGKFLLVGFCTEMIPLCGTV